MDNQEEPIVYGGKWEDRVLRAIESGEVKMKPRWYFWLQTALLAATIAVVALLLVFLASFIMFVLHQNGAWFAPGFGIPGWYILFASLPWLLILLSLGLVVAFATLLRRYPFVSREPLLYPLIAAIVLLVVGGFLITLTPLHANLAVGSFASAFYRNYETPMGDIHRGEVVVVTGNEFVLRDLFGNTSSVIFPTGNPAADLAPGDFVIVLGGRTADGSIEAREVEKVR